LKGPLGMALDRNGRLYVADSRHNRIAVLNPDGSLRAAWGSGQLSAPSALAVDGEGTVYVVDTGNNRVQTFSATGTPLAHWGSKGTGCGQFEHPSGIALDAQRNVYVTDSDSDRISEFTSDGRSPRCWGDHYNQLEEPSALAVDPHGTIDVAEGQLRYEWRHLKRKLERRGGRTQLVRRHRKKFFPAAERLLGQRPRALLVLQQRIALLLGVAALGDHCPEHEKGRGQDGHEALQRLQPLMKRAMNEQTGTEGRSPDRDRTHDDSEEHDKNSSLDCQTLAGEDLLGMKRDKRAAGEAVREKVGLPLGLTDIEAAAGILRILQPRRFGGRGRFLTRYPHQLPAPLPPFVRKCAFAPFTELFPLCAALMHHGGIGTTARALAAGTPQLILPLAYDQPDNAARVKRPWNTPFATLPRTTNASPGANASGASSNPRSAS